MTAGKITLGWEKRQKNNSCSGRLIYKKNLLFLNSTYSCSNKKIKYRFLSVLLWHNCTIANINHFFENI